MPYPYPSPLTMLIYLTTSCCENLRLSVSKLYGMVSSWVRKAKCSGVLMSLGRSLSQWWMELENKVSSFLSPQSAAILRSIFTLFPRSPPWNRDLSAHYNTLLLNTPCNGFFLFLSHLPTLINGSWYLLSK